MVYAYNCEAYKRVHYFSFMVSVFYSFNINTRVQRLDCTKLSACSQRIIYTTLSSIDSYRLKIQYFEYLPDTMLAILNPDNPELRDVHWLRQKLSP